MDKTLTVSQLNSYIKGVFDDELILQGINVTGEIFEFRTAGGNSYITLRDGDCILNCVFFSSVIEYAAGQQVQANGAVRFYPKSGKVSFIISSIKITGRGEILLALEKTRERLNAEGVFSNKRELPALVTRVAFITSEDGAVMHDFASVVSKIPYLQVVLFSARVQGKGAAEEIIGIMSDIGKGFLPRDTVEIAKNTANSSVPKDEKYFDVIVIARGGGSSADLSEFNSEALARIIHTSSVPVISAVGHETDYTLSDFAADIRAGTPSLAAEIIAANNARFFERLTNSVYFIVAKTEQIFEDRARRIGAAATKTDTGITGRLQGALSKTIYYVSKNQGLAEMLLRNYEYKIRTKTTALAGLLTAKIDRQSARLGIVSARTEQQSPLKILQKGYAKISKNSKEIVGVSSLCAGDEIELIMSDGSASATVGRTSKSRD